MEPLLPPQTQAPERKGEVFTVRKAKAWLPGREKLLAGLYLAFLVWQTAVLVPYTIHALYCCFKHRQVSFQCKDSMIVHGLEVELAMMISIVAHTAIFVWLLSKIPHFLGYRSIFRKLVRLPKFWSLVVLLSLGGIGLIVIRFTTKNFFMLSALVVLFFCYGVSVITLVGLLNYTQGEFIKQKYPYYKFVFFKLSLGVFLAENVAFFVVGSVEIAAGVTGLGEDASHDDLQHASFETLRHLAGSVLYYRLSDFLWQKLFTDNRNILHHFDNL